MGPSWTGCTLGLLPSAPWPLGPLHASSAFHKLHKLIIRYTMLNVQCNHMNVRHSTSILSVTVSDVYLSNLVCALSNIVSHRNDDRRP